MAETSSKIIQDSDVRQSPYAVNSAKATAKLPRSTSSSSPEFGGVSGCTLLIICLPIITLAVTLGCQNSEICLTYGNIIEHQAIKYYLEIITKSLQATKKYLIITISNIIPFQAILSYYSNHEREDNSALQGTTNIYQTKTKYMPNSWKELWSLEAQLIVVALLITQGILYLILPGNAIEGMPIKGLGGRRLKYKMNGMLQFAVFALLLAIGYPTFDISTRTFTGLKPYPLYKLYNGYMHVQLLTASIIVSISLSIFLYFWSFRNFISKKSIVLAEPGNTSRVIVDFFMGRELNPRPFFEDFLFDLKTFLELRYALFTWVLFDIAAMSTQYYSNGFISLPLLLLTTFQIIYVLDALIFEHAFLSSMDITTEGLGFMLIFGNVTWVPFMYSLQAKYLCYFTPNISLAAIGLISLIFLLGYWIFRCSNIQKHKFRSNPLDPSIAHLKIMRTTTGQGLLVSGWWGTARKINYLGDMLMGLSWCALSGNKSPIPHFYFPYIIAILVHRAWRDDTYCANKYGNAWQQYKIHVKYIFIPYII